MDTTHSEEGITHSVDVGFHATAVPIPTAVPTKVDFAKSYPPTPEPDRTPAPQNEQASAESKQSSFEATVQKLSWQVVKKASAQPELDDKLRHFVNSWCRLLGADQVVVLLRTSRGRPRVAAVSGTPTFDAKSDGLQQLEQIALSMGDSPEPDTWADVVATRDSDSILGTYARLNGFRSAILSPLVDEADGNVIGQIASFKSNTAIDFEKTKILSDELFPVIAGQIKLAKAAQGNRLTKSIRTTWDRLFVRKRIFWALIFAILAGIFFIPTEYEVVCDSTLEPTFRRYVASPFDGKLKKSLVEPGVSVTKAQVLAVLDGDEIRLELEAAKAEYKREAERQTAALQEGRVSDAQIAALEMQKLKHDIERYEQRISNLEIKSPIAGMIVSGDLEQSEGAPLTQGQTLFEVGPLDELNIEIEIPEAEVRFVRKGQAVLVRFHAFPFEKFEGRIESLFPRAEARNDQAVFIATARVSNKDGLLRPGMKGSTSIQTGPSFFGWDLFHGPAENLRVLFGR